MFGNTPLGLCCASGPPHGGRLRLRCTTASVVLGIGIGAIGAAYADPSLVLPTGLPVQVKPTFQEPGLPAFSLPAQRERMPAADRANPSNIPSRRLPCEQARDQFDGALDLSP